MTTGDSKPKSKIEPLTRADRLDYWQEIAKYLDREVRTVQRWEREKSLPVRRLSGDGDESQQPRVFAYKSEIDSWLALQSGQGAFPLGSAPGLTEANPSSVLRIAVLPLENSGGNPETEFLSDGVTDSLITRLSQLSSLRVISRTSVFRYKGQAIDPAEVGRELEVGAVLVGRMVTRGNAVSVSLELIDIRDNSIIWAGRYNRGIDDLVSVEDEISQSVAEKLEVKLTGDAHTLLPKRSQQNPLAYQLYLKGRYYWNKRTGDAVRRGLDYFNQAIEVDPGYGLAYAGIADSYAMAVFNIMISPRDGLPKARAAATRALELDARLAEARSSLAFVKMFYDWDWAGAEQEFRHTFELNPNYSIARQWYAMELAALGRHEEAVRETERGLGIDPLSLSINATSSLLRYFVRQYDEALQQGLATVEMDPNFFASHFASGLALEQKGQLEKAILEFRASADLSGRWPLFLAAYGHACAAAGHREEALKVIAELRDTSVRKYVSSFAVAAVYAGSGDNLLTLDWLEKAYDERGTWMIFLNVHPYFDFLRAEPRFQNLLRKMGLPKATRSS
ncbi:MAG: tetratricopeptide repeat protein [Candidatus Sulfotelmatobacter sp.]